MIRTSQAISVSVLQNGGVLSVVNQGQTAVIESVEPLALNALNVVDRVTRCHSWCRWV
jgi:hypothetical protein